jgi:hypothetical protein
MRKNVKFDPEKHRLAGPANNYTGMHPSLNRLEIAFDRKTGRQLYVLDRKEIISTEDAFALSTGRDRLKEITNIRRH